MYAAPLPPLPERAARRARPGARRDPARRRRRLGRPHRTGVRDLAGAVARPLPRHRDRAPALDPPHRRSRGLRHLRVPSQPRPPRLHLEVSGLALPLGPDEGLSIDGQRDPAPLRRRPAAPGRAARAPRPGVRGAHPAHHRLLRGGARGGAARAGGDLSALDRQRARGDLQDRLGERRRPGRQLRGRAEPRVPLGGAARDEELGPPPASGAQRRGGAVGGDPHQGQRQPRRSPSPDPQRRRHPGLHQLRPHRVRRAALHPADLRRPLRPPAPRGSADPIREDGGDRPARGRHRARDPQSARHHHECALRPRRDRRRQQPRGPRGSPHRQGGDGSGADDHQQPARVLARLGCGGRAGRHQRPAAEDSPADEQVSAEQRRPGGDRARRHRHVHRQSERAPPDLPESDHQRGAGDAPRRRAPRADLAPTRRSRPSRVPRHRDRHSRAAAERHLQSVLHHQVAGPGHRSRALGRAFGRAPLSRRHPGTEHSQRRHDLHDRSPLGHGDGERPTP